MSAHTKKNSFLGFLAGLSSLFGHHPKTTAGDLKNADFRTSTQSMGLRFTERIRDVFRFRWVRKN